MSCWIVCGLIVFVAIPPASGRREAAEYTAQHAKEAAAQSRHARAQVALEDALATPQALIGHCGQPARRVHGMLARDISEEYPAPPSKGIDTLIYPQGNGTLDVILSDSKDLPILMRRHDPLFDGRFASTLPERGMAMLQCKGAQ
jgi:hypothetical protein